VVDRNNGRIARRKESIGSSGGRLGQEGADNDYLPGNQNDAYREKAGSGLRLKWVGENGGMRRVFSDLYDKPIRGCKVKGPLAEEKTKPLAKARTRELKLF